MGDDETGVPAINGPHRPARIVEVPIHEVAFRTKVAATEHPHIARDAHVVADHETCPSATNPSARQLPMAPP